MIGSETNFGFGFQNLYASPNSMILYILLTPGSFCFFYQDKKSDASKPGAGTGGKVEILDINLQILCNIPSVFPGRALCHQPTGCNLYALFQCETTSILRHAFGGYELWLEFLLSDVW